MDDIVLISYFISLTILFVFGSHGFIMIYYYNKFKNVKPTPADETMPESVVTIQLPMYNELYVVERLIDSVCKIEYPKDKLEIQVLDDSTDETVEIVRRAVEAKKAEGFNIEHIRRGSREGFKAGALKAGMAIAKGEYIAIFDADFIPQPDFLKKTRCGLGLRFSKLFSARTTSFLCVFRTADLRVRRRKLGPARNRRPGLEFRRRRSRRRLRLSGRETARSRRQSR